MKAEHRKELQTNVLADQMGKLLKGMKTGPKSNSSVAWVLTILTIVVVAAWYYAGMSSNQSPLWVKLDEYSSSGNLEGLNRIATDNPGTLQARMARFKKAWILLYQEGLPAVYKSEKAAKNLEEARRLYEELALESKDDPVKGPEALMGAAKAEEALCGIPKGNDVLESLGNLDKAMEYYTQLKDKYRDSYLGQQAADHLESIKNDREKVDDFYKEMRKYLAEAGKKT